MNHAVTRRESHSDLNTSHLAFVVTLSYRINSVSCIFPAGKCVNHWKLCIRGIARHLVFSFRWLDHLAQFPSFVFGYAFRRCYRPPHTGLVLLFRLMWLVLMKAFLCATLWSFPVSLLNFRPWKLPRLAAILDLGDQSVKFASRSPRVKTWFNRKGARFKSEWLRVRSTRLLLHPFPSWKMQEREIGQPGSCKSGKQKKLFDLISQCFSDILWPAISQTAAVTMDRCQTDLD